ncbi:dephospho-CoA kinase [Mesorhizobium xinjiangense]|uniref:dephospho-CoA kinase n=1 Tax=Mesorhizobium xinjiangense TaxID=2678685 RepID=UPI0012EDEF6B|nr:dephospho-CoA kinase [Mesorhizobium xinjiangense]
MIRLGLTGSIGMGKSATAQMFADFGVPVHDADKTVHDLYRGKAVHLIEAAFPGTVDDGEVDRTKLSAAVLGDAAKLASLESIVHPLVQEAERRFLEEHERRGAPLVVLDIPLLFEVKATDRVDRILVVSAPEAVQRERVMARPGMTAQKLDAILAKQMPDAEKRRRADFIIDTSLGFDHARHAVADVITALTGQRPQVSEGGATGDGKAD